MNFVVVAKKSKGQLLKHDEVALEQNIDSFGMATINQVRDESYDVERFFASDERFVSDIYSRFDQVFDAPHAMKEVLIEQFESEQSYIGSKKTDPKVDEHRQAFNKDLDLTFERS